MFFNDKMDVKELREGAKRGVRGCSQMPKAKLIAAVRKTEKQRKISDVYKPLALLDSPVPNLQEPVL